MPAGGDPQCGDNMNDNKKLRLGKINYILLIIGILILTTGYVIMGLGDNTISPILLIIAYVVFIPLALLFPNKKPPDSGKA